MSGHEDEAAAVSTVLGGKRLHCFPDEALAARDARVAATARADALAPVIALAEGWVGFDDSHHYGDAILRAATEDPLPDG